MPAYTLGEIMSQATTRAGNRSDLDASFVSFLANESAMEVANAVPRTLSEATALLSMMSGSATTTLPANFGEHVVLSWLSGGSAVTLREVNVDDIDSAGTARGIPTMFAFYRDGIEVRPVPSSNLTLWLRYRTRWSDMVATSDVPSSIATEWRPAIVAKLEEKIHAVTGNPALEAVARQRYLNFVTAAQTDAARRQQGQHHYGVRVQ